MHLSRLVLVASLFLLCGAWAQQAQDGLVRPSGIPQEIERLQNMRILAVRRGDAASLAVVLPNDFTLVGPNGNVFTKAQILEALDADALTFDSFTFEDTVVRSSLHGAIVTGHYTTHVHYKDQDLSGRYRFCQVITRDGERTFVSFESDSFVGAVRDSRRAATVTE